jgi:hypothetical protein
MNNTLNIILYYLINKTEITDELCNKVVRDINKNYTPEEKLQILLDLKKAVDTSNFEMILPGIYFSKPEIIEFLQQLNNQFKGHFK